MQPLMIKTLVWQLNQIAAEYLQLGISHIDLYDFLVKTKYTYGNF